jgi:regulatory protein
MAMGRPFDNENGKNPVVDFATAKIKIAKFCAYQERAHAEVEQKLFSYGLFSEQVQELLAWSITENYVNEERFAIAFAGGKFRLKKWGKIKIGQQLQLKKVSQYSIDKALSLIEDEDYLATTQQLISQKWQSTTADNIYELRNKVARYVINKGYEPEKVWEYTKNIVI